VDADRRVGAADGGLVWPNPAAALAEDNPVSGEANWGHAFFIPLIGRLLPVSESDAMLRRG